jgi:hypothetical protein
MRPNDIGANRSIPIASPERHSMHPNRIRLRSAILALSTLALLACDQKVTGTSDEHETNATARLFKPNGAPAAGARVRIFGFRDTAQTPQAQVFAKADGSVVLPDLPKGQYTLLATDGSGNGLLIDSLLSTGAGSASLPSDTLRPMGTLTGRIAVEPQHSPRIAWVQILGLGLATNVDTLGNFRLQVPAGRLTIAALTRDAQYTPTFRSVSSVPESTVDVGVIRLEYTGIPVVTGIVASYDEATGVVSVKWNRPAVKGLRGYNLSRIRTGVVSSVVTLEDPNDTVFHDTIYVPGTLNIANGRAMYGVSVLDSTLSPGVIWEQPSVEYKSPFLAPKAPIEWDSIGRIPSGCGPVDTLGGGLVCFESHASSKQLDGTSLLMGEADSLAVWTSPEGRNWSQALPTQYGPLHAVAWRGRVWIFRGITGSESMVLANGGKLPAMSRGIVESWDLSGVRQRVDTIAASKHVAGFRLAVLNDSLVISMDSAYQGTSGATGPAGILPWSIARTHIQGEGDIWSPVSVSNYGDFPFDFVLADRVMIAMMMQDGGVSMVAWQNWESLAIGFSGGSLLAKRPQDNFSWQLNSEKIQPSPILMYRGNGQVAPQAIEWKGGILITNYDGALYKGRQVH